MSEHEVELTNEAIEVLHDAGWYGRADLTAAQLDGIVNTLADAGVLGAAARLADAEARAEAAVVLPDDEALAELLSWTTGDFTRWSPNAHEDHNRWSWRGEGHGESMRDLYRNAARELREALRGDQ